MALPALDFSLYINLIPEKMVQFPSCIMSSQNPSKINKIKIQSESQQQDEPFATLITLANLLEVITFLTK